ncbi:integrase core domain-containing protein [Gordonia westfalica]|uniref:Integrase core domain-containing protein n=1 Tax=Gordonia westfalica TaxID=158898 RepID=A0ABU2GPI6_9ACTN|nr:integrase core domain-containing protein [Gordonia westfalica]MDS1113373.1 integrase core domain-containing protein [Gordonia westfalica]
MLVLRRRRKRGAVVLAAELGMHASTVGRVSARHQMPHLGAIDPITGEVVRSSRRDPHRYEHRTPGSMVHVGVEELGRIPTGGGWRLHGRHAAISVANRHKTTKIGYDYVHTAIDDRTQLAYSEVLPDEKDLTSAGFLHRAMRCSPATTCGARRLLTDNAPVHRRGTNWGWVCTAWGLRRRFIKPGRPWTNGKAERFNRTLLNEWAYARPWTSNRALDQFLRRYNTQRGHSALGENRPSAGSPPDNNVSGHSN